MVRNNIPNPFSRPAILLFRGQGVISALIRWQTRGAVSHAAILLPDGRVLEAWQGDGVRIKTLESWKDVEAYEIEGATELQWADAIQFAELQVGRGYDYLGIIRFISRKYLPENDRWFCSELVYKAFEVAGIKLFERINASEVSPGLLRVSPKLKPIPIPT